VWRQLLSLFGLAAALVVVASAGAETTKPSKPSVYSVAPGTSCKREVAVVHGGPENGKRVTILAPPRPGLRAVALSARRIRLHWSFASLPRACRPVALLGSVIANDFDLATPTNRQVKLTGTSGSLEITYPDFLPPPDVAMASSYTAKGLRSSLARVLIKR
jgi:hypothetical protein